VLQPQIVLIHLVIRKSRKKRIKRMERENRVIIEKVFNIRGMVKNRQVGLAILRRAEYKYPTRNCTDQSLVNKCSSVNQEIRKNVAGSI